MWNSAAAAGQKTFPVHKDKCACIITLEACVCSLIAPPWKPVSSRSQEPCLGCPKYSPPQAQAQHWSPIHSSSSSCSKQGRWPSHLIPSHPISIHPSSCVMQTMLLQPAQSDRGDEQLRRPLHQVRCGRQRLYRPLQSWSSVGPRSPALASGAWPDAVRTCPCVLRCLLTEEALC